MSFWGPHYPESFWGPHYPQTTDVSLIQPIGPVTAATFLVELESGFTVKYCWKTDVIKAYDGTETRHSYLDYPQQIFDGEAILLGNQARSVRSALIKHSATGAAFLLGLPYEAVSINADASGTMLSITTLTMDWIALGQRVIVLDIEGNAIEATIQNYGGIAPYFQLHLDVSPGSIGRNGGSVMPAIPIYFDAQLGFNRYSNPDPVERWKISGRSALFGFLNSQTYATLPLEGVALGGGFDFVVLKSKLPGTAGNSIQVEMSATSLSGINFIEDPIAKTITIEFVPGDTVGDFVTGLQNSELIEVYGTWNNSSPMVAGADEFGFISLSGGTDEIYNEIGVGATLTTFLGKPLWDRGIRIEDEAPDSLHTLTEFGDLGGVVFNRGGSNVPDGGRHVGIRGTLGPEWQWLKKFLHTAYGAWKSFWLPSWRQDLLWISSGVNSIVIEGPDDDSGSFFTYYPTFRTNIQIQQEDGTITRTTITNAVDNGDGTVTLTIGTTLSGSDVDMISWIELCRFEGDEFSVEFSAHNFLLETVAREIQQ